MHKDKDKYLRCKQNSGYKILAAIKRSRERRGLLGKIDCNRTKTELENYKLLNRDSVRNNCVYQFILAVIFARFRIDVWVLLRYLSR